MKGSSRIFIITVFLLSSLLINRLSGGGYGEIEFSRRLKRLESLAERLDTGSNRATAKYCIAELRKNPGLIELADGLINTRSRGNRLVLDDLLEEASVDLVDEGQRGLYRSFVEYSVRKISRDFAASAEGMAGAGSLYETSGDHLSALICFFEGIESYIGARNPSEAGLLVKKARECLQKMPYQERLDLELLSLEAEIANLSDDLSTADSLQTIVLKRSEENEYRNIRAYCCAGIGRLNEKRQKIDSAAEYYSRALKDYRVLGAVENQSIMLNNLGQAYSRLKNIGKAREFLEEAEKKAESINAEWLLGYIDYGLGAIAETEGEKGKALGFFRLSFENHLRSKNRWGELGARLRLAYIHVLNGEYRDAIEHYNHCIDAYEKMESWYGLNWALGGMAMAKHRFGDLKGAEEFYRRAYELKIKLGDRRGAAWCLNSLGMVCDLQGRYREALVNELEAMKIYREVGDESGQGEVHFSIGSAYFYLGNYRASIKHYGEAQEIAVEKGNTDLLKRVASGMGSIYSVSGRFDLAEKFYKDYLKVAVETGDRNDLAWANNNLASHYLTVGNLSEARKYILKNRSLIEADERESSYGIRALYIEGKASSSVDSAIVHLEKAAGLAKKKGLEELHWKCLSDLGEKYAEKDDRGMAKKYFDEAIRTVESLRFLAGENELQRHMLRSAVTPYERIVSLILEAEDGEKGTIEAFEYMERSRAQIIAARLREASSGSFFRDNKVDNQEKLQLISRLTYLQNNLQDGKLDSKERKALNREIDHIEDDFRGLRLKMAGKGKRRFSEIYPEEEDMAELMTSLRPDERLLSYFLGIDRSYLVSVYRGSMKYYLLPGRADLEKKVRYFLSLFSVTDNAGADEKGTLPASLIESAGKHIYNLLIGPADEDISDGERLVIVPDGILGRLSFSLLKSGSGYLCDEHEIFYTPSLRSLYYLRDRAARKGESGDFEYGIISFGCRGQSEKYGSSRVYPFTDITVETLPNAEKEAEMVASFFSDSLVLTGSKATEQGLKNAPLEKTGFLHFAAHSHIDNDDPRRSFIVVESRHDEGDTLSERFEDGLLQWHEITSLDLRGSFVSLSACRSAGGVTSYGEGVAGLTQAFIHAGSRCVLASLTDVPDSYAERFMVGFYRKLSEGMHPASALGELQREARDWDVVKKNPGLWASFILTGDGMALTGTSSVEKYE